MDTATALNWLELRRIVHAQARQDDQARILMLTRENARLARENGKLREQYTELTASTEIWIRLYESALERANGAVECVPVQPSNLLN